MNKQEHIKIMRKTSANTFYDNVMIAYKSNRKLRKQYPNLLSELRFHRDNYYDLIDKYKHIDGTISPKLETETYGKSDKKAKGFMET